MSLLLKIGGENYFLDFVNIEKLLSSGNSGFKGGMVIETKVEKMLGSDGSLLNTKVMTHEYHKSKEVDGFRYETIREMIDILLDSNDLDEDDVLTKSLENKPISFKLAFNTLLEYGILNIAE